MEQEIDQVLTPEDLIIIRDESRPTVNLAHEIRRFEQH